MQRLLAQMVDAGCTYAVMEVSSHALMQSRVEGIRFRVGVFTNLTQDHLDYHGTMEAYCDAKSRLFDRCDIACVNGDDAWTERLLARFTSERITFGQGMTNDLVGWHARYENDCVCFTACTDLDHEETKIGIPGGFSLYNALAALCAVQALGVPLSDAAKALTECVGVKGRCEVVPLDAPFTVIIDYAHTPDGLKNILSTVCGFADGRVIALFGCGGDRDRTKRPRMGRIAAALSDMDIHSMTEYAPFDPMTFEREALTEKRGLIPQIEPRYRYPYFSHIFDGGYSAGYYFYTWAEVLDKDAFEAFRESGDLFNRRIADDFRHKLLARGGSEDGMTLYRAFRGKDPDKRAMLKGRGLWNEPDPEPADETESRPGDDMQAAR